MRTTFDDSVVRQGIPNTEETRRLYRQMLLTTPDAAEYLSGVILFDETTPFREGRRRGLVEPRHPLSPSRDQGPIA